VKRVWVLCIMLWGLPPAWAGPPVKVQGPARQQVDRTAESKREKELEGPAPLAPRATPTPPTSSQPAASTPKAADNPYHYDVLPVKMPGQVEPIYPKEALEKELQGRVLLHVWLDSHGYVYHVKIYQSSGHAVLDDSASEAVRRWRYRPAKIGGLVTPSEILVPIRFIIRDPS
jgi:protein TonB